MTAGNEAQAQGSPAVEAERKDEQRLPEARDALNRVFSLLGIDKAIVVDDELTSLPDFEDFVGTYRALLHDNPNRLKQVNKRLGVAASEDEIDDLRQDLRARWDELNDEAREALMIMIGHKPNRKVISKLGELLSQYQPEFLSLAQWRQRQEMLTSPQALSTSLLLFDLDMSKEEGGTSDEGMRIIKALLERHAGKCQCALLSHHIAKDAEYKDLQKFTEDHQLGERQARFVVISKLHLPDEPIIFAQRLKRAAITSPCDALRREVAAVLNQAFSEAKCELAQLNVYDFEQIVFQSSYAEGVWEPDTLLRILALYNQRSARALLKGNRSVEKNASLVRSLIDIPYRPSDAPAPKAQEIMRLEMYEDGAFLNEHHIPIDLGDIFQTASGVGEFILLAQPCDIMCRNNKGDNQNRRREVLVAPIVERPATDKSFERSSAFGKLEAYSDNSATAKYADFDAVRAVPIMPLDLTVFEPGGNALLCVNDVCPENVINSWQLRFADVKEEVKALLQRYEEWSATGLQAVQGEVMETVARALAMSVSGFVTGTLDSASCTIKYDIRRVSRLKTPKAAALLRAFASHLSRDAFEHPLTRTLYHPG